MDIFQNQCSESLGFDSMLSSNHLNSPLHDSPGSPNALTFAPSSPYFSSISQQLCGSSGTSGSTSGPNDVILPSIFVKIPTQINQQYQQENRLRNARPSGEIKCEERAEPIKSEVAETRLKLAGANLREQPLPDVIDSYLNDTRGTNGATEEESAIVRCDYCPFATLSEANLSEHKRMKHAGGERMLLETIGCPVCENKFFKKPVLHLHLLEDHEMARNEVDVLCSMVVSMQQDPECGQPTVASSATATSGTLTPTFTSTAAPNKSRIYIKNVQLLKKPDFFAQESDSDGMQQDQDQQLLPVEQQQAPASSVQLCPEEHQLSSTEPTSHDQFHVPEHSQHHQPPQQSAGCVGSGSKIFIRNVSLLQNVNFTPSAENMLLSNGSKYHTYMNLDCQSNPSPPIDTATLNDGYSQMLPSTVATQPRGNRIYIKNVDILRNPLLSLGTAPPGPANSYTSRASSCESIICTTTPPPSQPSQPSQQTLPQVQQAATIIPLSQIQPPPSHFAQPGNQASQGCGISGSLGTTMDGGVLGLEELISQQQQPISGQGTSVSLPLMFSTPHESLGLVDSCASPASSVSSCISVVPISSPSCMATAASSGTSGSYQLPTFSCDGQQEQRKSKIFIKNISVLKQPTIHLKSVDEVNLMTYDQLQLQNLLPAGVSSVGASMHLDPSTDHLQGCRQEALESGSESIETDRINDQSFVMDVNVEHHHHQQQQQQQQQHEEAMDGYHDASCYDDLDVCDFTDGFNERDDPGGGGGGAISVPSGCSNNNTLSITCDGILDEAAHCDNFQSGFDQNIILLQPNSGIVEAPGSEKMSESWPPVVSVGLSVSQDLAGTSVGVSIEGTMSAQYDDDDGDDQGQSKDILFICEQEVINLDPQNDEPKVGEEVQRGEASTEGELPMEQGVLAPDIGLSTVDSSLQATVPPDPVNERPRTRGRPKGAKQTGITKLKKLYTNLTPQEEGYKCDIQDCGSRFRQPERLEYHRKCHLPVVEQMAGSDPITTNTSTTTNSGTIATRCPECGSQEFRNWNTLHTHLWREHGIDMELYSCHLCAFKTPVLCRLTNTHMKIHSEERNFKCIICEKAFKNNKQLRNHRRSHREPAQQTQQQHPVEQQQQQQQHQQQEALPTSNAQQSSGERMEVDATPSEAANNAAPLPIKCVKCGQKFTSQRQLHSHMDAKHPAPDGGQSSQGAGKHRCVLCGMMFKTRYLLQSHSAKHSDEKRFKCEHCDYTTNDHNAFRRHKMRHNTKGSHMYKCSYCDYTSIQSTTYRKHLERMHADVASTLLYKCAQCAFVSISELKYQLHKAKHEHSPEHAGEDCEDGDGDEGRAGARDRMEGNRSQGEDMRATSEQLPFVEDYGPAGDLTMVNGDDQVQLQQVEDDSRACESVNSDVMIVDNREPMLGAPPVGMPEVQHHHHHRDDSVMQIVQVQQQQQQQQPIIRPAMFANNFSKVDNFYGHQQPPQLQPKILKLTDRIPSHRGSPLGQMQLQPHYQQPTPVPASALPTDCVVPPVCSSAAITQDPAGTVGFLQMAAFDMQEHQHQQHYEHMPTFTNTVDDIALKGDVAEGETARPINGCI